MARRRVVVCLGPGGVGKTSIVAALALGAALSGKRVLAITIDPARRLAQALGLPEIQSDSSRVDLSELARALEPSPGGENAPASPTAETGGFLDVRMLDAGSALAELVRQRAKSESTRQALLNNRAFGFLVRNMAGVQPYMAMETVLALERTNQYDIIFVDTPPSERALEFLDAPERMQRLLESPITKTLTRVGKTTSELGQGLLGKKGLLGKGAKLFFKGVSQVTGAGLVDELSVLLGALGELLLGFFDRAVMAEERFRSHDFGVVLVTAAGAIEASEASRMLALLLGRELNLDAVVLNRVYPDWAAELTAEQVAAELGAQDAGAFGPLLEEARAEAWVHRAAERLLAAGLKGRAAVFTLPRIAGELKTRADLLELEAALTHDPGAPGTLAP